MAYEKTTLAKTKKMKRPLTESESENEMDENFYQFIVLESIEETPTIPIPNSKNNRNTL